MTRYELLYLRCTIALKLLSFLAQQVKRTVLIVNNYILLHNYFAADVNKSFQSQLHGQINIILKVSSSLTIPPAQTDLNA